ncbi:pyrroline-5-carboxylate reductase [Methyloceanibacter sp.]|uniref:pyrroline-5-carboxylate reductase n=1 Tax=Methyloceanibacter sp. TaxID=1965321 RepID=UPI002D380831|nr:pyrroline-5-carboxylate reductase [Methyloceanibacter sp.]HZP08201.1 pyrroline-5-carboxylate reductase [Methyloceanibacter sp.]
MTLRLAGPLVLVGAGKMGGALLEGWLRQGLEPEHVFVRDPSPPPEVAALVKRHGIETARLPEEPAVIVIAVKPQLVEETLAALAPAIGKGTVVLSIAAGRTLASLAKPLPKDTAIVRAMPNTAAAIGRSMTAACANAEVSREQALACGALLEAIGEVIWLDDERLMDAVTAVSGSGPAYVFLLAECLAEAGREAGLDAELANQLARATVSGAGALLAQSDLSAARLRENVTSPKGTTAAALEILMGTGGFKDLLIRAVAAAAKRSRELSS